MRQSPKSSSLEVNEQSGQNRAGGVCQKVKLTTTEALQVSSGSPRSWALGELDW